VPGEHLVQTELAGLSEDLQDVIPESFVEALQGLVEHGVLGTEVVVHQAVVHVCMVRQLTTAYVALESEGEQVLGGVDQLLPGLDRSWYRIALRRPRFDHLEKRWWREWQGAQPAADTAPAGRPLFGADPQALLEWPSEDERTQRSQHPGSGPGALIVTAIGCRGR
jgi:hypothetical protein